MLYKAPESLSQNQRDCDETRSEKTEKVKIEREKPLCTPHCGSEASHERVGIPTTKIK